MVSFNLIVIKTAQPDVLHDFYTQLGFTFAKHRHGQGPEHYAAETGQLVFEIYPLPKSVTVADTTTRLGFTVTHLDDIIKEKKVVSPPAHTEWGYTAVIEDPDGRKIELKQAD